MNVDCRCVGINVANTYVRADSVFHTTPFFQTSSHFQIYLWHYVTYTVLMCNKPHRSYIVCPAIHLSVYLNRWQIQTDDKIQIDDKIQPPPFLFTNKETLSNKMQSMNFVCQVYSIVVLLCENFYFNSDVIFHLQFAKTFFNLMSHIAKDQTLQYILTMLDDVLQVNMPVENYLPCFYCRLDYVFLFGEIDWCFDSELGWMTFIPVTFNRVQ